MRKVRFRADTAQLRGSPTTWWLLRLMGALADVDTNSGMAEADALSK
jgi:hypothetical protein